MPPASATSGNASDDPVIYFTLIDFLLQVIFFSLMLFVVLQHVGHAPQENQRPGWVDDPVNLPLMRDMTPFVTIKKEAELRELLRLLKDRGALDQFLDYLRQNPDPLRFMEQCRAHPEACRRFGAMTASDLGRLGAGKPACLAGDPALLSVDAYDDRLVVTSISAAGASQLRERRLALRPRQVILKSEVTALLSPLALPGCRYTIRYVKRGDSEDMRHLTEQSLHLSIVRGAAGEPR
jgi:hypothetical protein